MSSRDCFFCSRVTFDPVSLKCNTISWTHHERNYSTEPFPLDRRAKVRLFVELWLMVSSELLVFVIIIIVKWVETHLKRQISVKMKTQIFSNGGHFSHLSLILNMVFFTSRNFSRMVRKSTILPAFDCLRTEGNQAGKVFFGETAKNFSSCVNTIRA